MPLIFPSCLPVQQKYIWSRLEPLSGTPWGLYGGPAIALRLGHRVSVDFDFFSHAPLNKKELYQMLPWLETGGILQEQGHTLTISLPVGDDYGHFEKLLFPDKRTNREWTRMNANISKPVLVQQNYLFPEFASIRVHSRLKRLFQSALNKISHF
ncbi:MAG: hypothetical protein LBK99_22155 [Opitutaceae bacterium]|nr:hypothetical protein [Opitutaceae bacterium]